MASLQLCLIMVISMVVTVHSRMLRLNTSQHLIPDSVDRFEKQNQIIHLNDSSLSSHFCPSIYGFFPCAYNTGGFIFQIVIYEYLLYVGEKLVTIGSDRLLQIFGSGIYGASFFQILKVLPGLTTLIVSGVITSKAKAQEQVSQGVSVYAGSTILSLTLVWLMSVIFGRKEIKPSTAESKTSTAESSGSKCMLWKEKLYGFMELGIKTDESTRYTAGIMLLTLIPFAMVELVNIFNTSLARRVVILVALIVSSASLFSYFVYQIWKPWMQQRSLAYIVKGKLINEDGQLNIPEIIRLFRKLDINGDQFLTLEELENLTTLAGFTIGELVSKTFDLNNDRKIRLQEFIEGFVKFKEAAKELAEKDDGTTKDISEIMWGAVEKKHGLINKLLTKAFNKSVFQVLLGIVMLTFLVKPLTISIRQFSDAMGLSSLIVSFVIVPVALNGRRLAIFSSNPLSERIASLTFSEIYGGVIMNNLTGLVTVLAIIYAKDLKWEYSAEVLIMFVVCAIVGFFAFLRTNYPIWTCIIAFLLYPLSLVLFYFVHHLLGRRT